MGFHRSQHSNTVSTSFLEVSIALHDREHQPNGGSELSGPVSPELRLDNGDVSGQERWTAERLPKPREVPR
jgi:hypothetical protein